MIFKSPAFSEPPIVSSEGSNFSLTLCPDEAVHRIAKHLGNVRA